MRSSFRTSSFTASLSPGAVGLLAMLMLMTTACDAIHAPIPDPAAAPRKVLRTRNPDANVSPVPAASPSPNPAPSLLPTTSAAPTTVAGIPESPIHVKPRQSHWLSAESSAQLTSVDLNQLSTAFHDSAVTDEAFAQLLAQQSGLPLMSTDLTAAKKLLRSLVGIRKSKLFTAPAGKVGSFDHLPNGFSNRTGIQYYLPASVNLAEVTQPVPLLFMLHGGGDSTNTYDKAKAVSISYLKQLIPFAESAKVIIIAPSSSIGWNLQTRGLIPEIVELAQSELPIDGDRRILWGHSMGAMGITREVGFLVGLFSGFNANNGGTQLGYQDKRYLKTYFNTHYTHINGLKDHFEEFLPLMRQVEAKTAALETELGLKSGFQLIVHGGTHAPDFTLISRELSKLLLQPRDLYQKAIFPLYFGADYAGGANSPAYPGLRVRDYFWLQSTDSLGTPLPSSTLSSFEARIRGNEIDIVTQENALKLSHFKLLLAPELVDLTLPVIVRVDGKVTYQGIPNRNLMQLIHTARQKKDPRFLYDAAVDLSF